MVWLDRVRGRLPGPIGDLSVAAAERSMRGWAIAGVTAAVVVSAAGSTLMARAGVDSAAARTVEAAIAEREARLASLDAERKQREDRLAELTRRLNASETQLAETTDRVARLDKRRETLQRQVAELAEPASPEGEERVVGGGRVAAVAGRTAGVLPDETGDLTMNANRVEALSRGPDREAAPARVAVDRETEAQADIVASAAQDGRGSVRVFIHVRSSDPTARSRARAVAAELRRRGVSVAEIRGVRLPVRRDAVRFFYDADRSAVSTLQEAVRDSDGSEPQAQDYRSYGAPPRPGTIELWLS